MGVEDDGTPIGINRNMSKDMRKNFVNQLNNPDRMSPTLYLSIEEFEIPKKVSISVVFLLVFDFNYSCFC